MNSGEVSPAHAAALAQILGAIPKVKGEQRQLCVASLLGTDALLGCRLSCPML